MWVSISDARRARLSRSGRRGVSVVYIGVAMLALFALASLAVDLGRVRTCHEQLQNGADAAALAAAVQLPTVDFAGINQTAIDVAAKNPAMETMVNVQSADIEYGNWDLEKRQFTVLTGNDRNAANAIRVTAQRIATRNNALPLFLASVIGVKSSDIRTIATSYIAGGERGFGIVGINSIKMTGTSLVDSYNAAAGPYNPASPDHDGAIASNGDITLVGTVDVWGDSRAGVDHVTDDSTLVHGWAGPLDQPLVYPPATVPSGTQNKGALKLTGNKPGSIRAFPRRATPR
jgi:Flp pilus assembly protein TadG